MKMNVFKSENGFLYIHKGRGSRIWVNPRLVQKDDDGGMKIEFPILNAKLKRKKTGTVLLVPELQFVTYHLYFECGYRGDSDIEFEEDPEVVEKYEILHSPRGSLGISEGAFFTYPNDGKERVIHLRRSGRLYGSEPEYVVLIKGTNVRQFTPDEFEIYQSKEVK